MTINYQVLGQGPNLILIHGLFGTLDNLKGIAKQLAEDFSVYLVDAPAHGDSSTPTPLNLSTMASLVEDFITTLGLEDVSILGHSLGGKIAMEVALNNHINVKKLIVADIAPVQYTRRHDKIIQGLTTTPLTLDNRQQADAHLSQYIDEVGIRAFLLKSFVRSEDKNWRWRFDLDALNSSYDQLIAANQQGSFDAPVLFVIGGESNYVTPDYQKEIVSRFPKVKAKVVQGTGHWLHAEKPTAFVKICRDFLLD